MEKIAIMTDVNAGLDYDDKHYDITVLRSMINFGDEHYIDGIEIKAKEFYKRLQKTKVIPSTSAPTVGETMQYLDKMISEGYTDVIMYAISFKLSCIGTMVESLIEEYKDKINIHVVDTKTSASSQGYMANVAYEMARDGKSVQEILDYSNYLIEREQVYFVVDDLMYLVKNGRLSGVAGTIGSLLQIKPILEINKDGYIVIKQKERTQRRALEALKKLFIEKTKNSNNVVLTVYHTCREEDANNLLAEYMKEFPCVKEGNVSMISPAVGAHIGCNVLGIGVFVLD